MATLSRGSSAAPLMIDPSNQTFLNDLNSYYQQYTGVGATPAQIQDWINNYQTSGIAAGLRNPNQFMTAVGNDIQQSQQAKDYQTQQAANTQQSNINAALTQYQPQENLQYGQLYNVLQGQYNQGQQGINQEMASRGLLDSGSLPATMAQLSQYQGQQASQGANEIQQGANTYAQNYANEQAGFNQQQALQQQQENFQQQLANQEISWQTANTNAANNPWGKVLTGLGAGVAAPTMGWLTGSGSELGSLAGLIGML